ncbi:MAG TPA: hypothetical protein VGE01_10620, partial [Fimbriimonas sp.]
RTAYLLKMPTWGRKFRLGADWFLDFLLPSPPVQLGIGRSNREIGRVEAKRDSALAEKASVK